MMPLRTFVGDVLAHRALRIVPASKDVKQIQFTITENLEPGTWVVTAKMRGCRLSELVAWRQTGGRGHEDGVFAASSLPKDGWKTFAKKNTVYTGEDGLNLIVKAIGVGKEGLLVGDVRVRSLNIADGGVFKGRRKASMSYVTAMALPKNMSTRNFI